LLFGSLPDLFFDCVNDVLLLDDTVIVDQVDFLLEMDNGEFLKGYIEDQNALDGLFEEVEERVVS
jgi:hypothetical protein